jgi:hypothetical protein
MKDLPDTNGYCERLMDYGGAVPVAVRMREGRP